MGADSNDNKEIRIDTPVCIGLRITEFGNIDFSFNCNFCCSSERKFELALIIEKKDFNPLVLEEFQNFKEIPKKAKNKEKLDFGCLSDLNDKMRKS